MRVWPKILLVVTGLVAGTAGGRAAEATMTTTPTAGEPWASPAWSFESGLLWQALHTSHSTPLSYRLVPNQLSWRSARAFGWTLDDGSQIVVRHRLTLLAIWVQQGPESHYIAFDGSPSVEWWNKAGTSSVWAGAGGGVGAIDSRGVKGGQGQDLTLNWFLRTGIEHKISGNSTVTAGVQWQHLSNGGMTNPNPSINAIGFTLGYSRSY